MIRKTKAFIWCFLVGVCAQGARAYEDPDKGRPHEHFCPITCEVMRNPVVALDGYSYEREAISTYLSTNLRSPLTNLPLESAILIPNINLRILIEEWKPRQEVSPSHFPIPDVARGHEELYERFMRGKLVYRPNRDDDSGMVEIPISSLANPLDGTFDLSACGNTSLHLSIHTGFKSAVEMWKGKNDNPSAVEMWICPKFLGATAPQFRHIMGQWESPIAYFWTCGAHVVASDNFDYLLNTEVCMETKLNCYRKYLRSGYKVGSRSLWDVFPAMSAMRSTLFFYFEF
jgi:hypothetical protein